MHRLWLALGALAGLGTVALSAWAAHALPQRLNPARLASVQSALQIQGLHALALLAVGVLTEGRGGLVTWAGAAFAIGLLMFCGAVYASAIGGVSLGRVAPLGGGVLMLGWLLLLVAALRR
jgi:uncharacterized membrane protein YgdD (TMEM256/DUF423 family)